MEKTKEEILKEVIENVLNFAMIEEQVQYFYENNKITIDNAKKM